ncbi:hypothetical protein T10_4911 [Trichinella papuae]|uniref:Uncharacterized protein n=1 Tax=Trichinella papuae TaxID=268474 RepID=A0A0V1MWT9_9BILA|nr:hypothetical protein T10_4911 [Trichinella papuae]
MPLRICCKSWGDSKIRLSSGEKKRSSSPGFSDVKNVVLERVFIRFFLYFCYFLLCDVGNNWETLLVEAIHVDRKTDGTTQLDHSNGTNPFHMKKENVNIEKERKGGREGENCGNLNISSRPVLGSLGEKNQPLLLIEIECVSQLVEQ